MEDESIEKGRITPEKALVLLQKGGMNVTKKQAREILELLTVLAKLEVKRYLKK